MAVVHRLKRKVRVLMAQKRRLVWELRAAQTVHVKSPPTCHQPEE